MGESQLSKDIRRDIGHTQDELDQRVSEKLPEFTSRLLAARPSVPTQMVPAPTISSAQFEPKPIVTTQAQATGGPLGQPETNDTIWLAVSTGGATPVATEFRIYLEPV